MKSCDEVKKRIGELAALPAVELPAGIHEHLAGCAACTRALAAARLGRGLLAAAGDGVEPPTGFADRVLGALPDRIFELTAEAQALGLTLDLGAGRPSAQRAMSRVL
ncbi:MAG: hypothetical protein HYW08_01865, partial [candidate division NC10 bacterium]|nr:hypothetical protein [candidate division NC10 bacterium]